MSMSINRIALHLLMQIVNYQKDETNENAFGNKLNLDHFQAVTQATQYTCMMCVRFFKQEK